MCTGGFFTREKNSCISTTVLATHNISGEKRLIPKTIVHSQKYRHLLNYSKNFPIDKCMNAWKTINSSATGHLGLTGQWEHMPWYVLVKRSEEKLIERTM